MVKRYGQVIELRPGAVPAYEEAHRAVWPEVETALKAANIQNYSIFRHGALLFAYMEYVGNDFESDMKATAANSACVEWGKLMSTLQQGVNDGDPSWTDLPEVYHLD